MKNKSKYVQHDYEKLSRKSLKDKKSKFKDWLKDSEFVEKENKTYISVVNSRTYTLGECFQIYLLKQ